MRIEGSRSNNQTPTEVVRLERGNQTDKRSSGGAPRVSWCQKFEGSDPCFTPMLTPEEAAALPIRTNAARGLYSRARGFLEGGTPRISGFEQQRNNARPS